MATQMLRAADMKCNFVPFGSIDALKLTILVVLDSYNNLMAVGKNERSFCTELKRWCSKFNLLCTCIYYSVRKWLRYQLLQESHLTMFFQRHIVQIK